MKLFLKIFSIFTPKEQRYCAFLVAAMMIGAALEAVGIGTILPGSRIFSLVMWRSQIMQRGLASQRIRS